MEETESSIGEPILLMLFSEASLAAIVILVLAIIFMLRFSLSSSPVLLPFLAPWRDARLDLAVDLLHHLPNLYPKIAVQLGFTVPSGLYLNQYHITGIATL